MAVCACFTVRYGSSCVGFKIPGEDINVVTPRSFFPHPVGHSNISTSNARSWSVGNFYLSMGLSLSPGCL